MTYHMERTMRSRGRGGRGRGFSHVVDGEVVRRIKFPEKLFDVISEGSDLLQWNYEGTNIIVNADDFELEIMDKHPGLVQISTFANFRRQMRWYGFEWEAIDDYGNFQFTHKNFLRDRKDLVDLIFNKKKSYFERPQRYRRLSDIYSKPEEYSSFDSMVRPRLSRGTYKPRGKRGRPRKRPAASPSQRLASVSDEDLRLDEAQLDQVAAVLEQSSTKPVPINPLPSKPSPSCPPTGVEPAPSNHAMLYHPCYRASCRQAGSPRQCCHCCCHCCCCHGDDSWWRYCRPWMPRDSVSNHTNLDNNNNSDFPNLSYYDEFARFVVRTNSESTISNPSQPPAAAQLMTMRLSPTQLGGAQLVPAVQDGTAAQPIEFILCTPTQLYQSDPANTHTPSASSQHSEQTLHSESPASQPKLMLNGGNSHQDHSQASDPEHVLDSQASDPEHVLDSQASEIEHILESDSQASSHLSVT